MKTAYYIHAKHVRIIYAPKSIFAYQYHEISFLFGVLFIRIFMRPGSNFLKKKKKDFWVISYFILIKKQQQKTIGYLTVTNS